MALFCSKQKPLWISEPSRQANTPEAPIDEDGALGPEDARKCQRFLQGIVERVKESATAIMKHMTAEFGAEATDPTRADHEMYQNVSESEYEASAEFDDITKDIVEVS